MKASQCLGALFLLALFVAVRGLDKDIVSPNRETQFFKRYAITNMMEACYDKETVQFWQWRLQKYWYECEREVRPFRPNVTRATAPYSFRAQPFYGFDRAGHVTYHTNISITVQQCVFDRLNLVPTKAVVNILKNDLKKNVKKRLDGKLMRFVSYGIKRCFKEMQCQTFVGFGNEMVEFQKLQYFYNCEMNSRVRACIKRDIMKYKSNFVIGALGKALKGVSHNNKRLAISTFYANSNLKGLFEFEV